MARDKRNRVRTIDVRWALVSEASGDWLHLNTTLTNVLDWYANNTNFAEGDEATRYDRSDPNTWHALANHMWMNDVEIVRIDPITFTLGRGEDRMDALVKYGAAALPPDVIAEERETLAINNTFASTERP